MQVTSIGIVGLGKIARESHLPAILESPAFELAATASLHEQLPGVASFPSIQAMLDAMPQMGAVAICTPPQVRYELARFALERGKHVLLEKPPCALLAQLEHLTMLARGARKSLYQSWHSQHAAAVESAVLQLRQRTLRRVRIIWKEDVTEWHPGHRWLWESGGFGVFDAGLNALSILTRLIATPIFARSAQLHVPVNCATAIAADLELESAERVPISATLDFRYRGTPIWQIDLETEQGPLVLADGGTRLSFGGEAAPPRGAIFGDEYRSIYRRFAQLMAGNAIEVDTRPLACLADLFLVAKHRVAEPFVG